MNEQRYESRGIECLSCLHIDLQSDKEAAKRGFGKCKAVDPQPYVSALCARNCLPFDPAPAEVVGPREEWAKKLKHFWQK